MKTRFILAGIAAMLTAPLAAQAADLPQPSFKAPSGIIAPSIASWTGWYVGINGGWGSGTSNWTNVVGTTGGFTTKGGLVGATAGYNLQTGNWVWGIETDIDWSNIK